MVTKIEKIEYNKQNYFIKRNCSIEDALRTSTDKKEWIKVIGLDDTQLIEQLTNGFMINELTSEDILHTNQVPRIEVFDNYTYFVLRRVYFDKIENDFRTEQISIILKDSLVITFQQIDDNMFSTVDKIIETNNLSVRNFGVDFLAYLFVDVIVDEYLEILSEIYEKIEEYEEELMQNADKMLLSKIFLQKKQLILLKKVVSPLIRHFFEIKNLKTHLISRSVLDYFKDISDHTVKIDTTIDTYRETLTALVETFTSMQSMKLNEVMKVFTAIATVFMPLTLITGIYGMNFEYMPFETHWRWGFYLIMSVLVIVGIGLYFVFRKKRMI